MRSRDVRFVRVSIMAQGGDSNKRWILKWTRLLCRSLSASLNLISGFLQIGLLLQRLLRIFFPAQIVSGCKEWPECDSLIHVFKLRQFVRHDYPYYYDKFDDRILRIPDAKFCHSVAHVYLQTSNLASLRYRLLQRFWTWCQRWLRWSRMLSYKRGSKKCNFDWAALFLVPIAAAKW